MRRKPWALPELTACDYYILRSPDNCGHWYERFARRQPLYMELGCGKGVSTAQMVSAHPEINYVAIDVSIDILGVARRNISAAYGDRPVDNVLLTDMNIEYIEQHFTMADAVERIYINFCNPWSQRKKHFKRRLTHPRQLAQYRKFLVENGEIWFKTDSESLFRDSLEYFAESGFEIRYLTHDLHADGFQPNYISEHEAKFTAMGMPIHFLIARKIG